MLAPVGDPIRSADRRPALTRSALGTYAAQIAISVLSLVNVFIVARTLGPAGRGEVAFLVAVAYLTSQFASLGVQYAHSNLAASRPELRSTLAANAAVFAAVFGGASAVLLILAFRVIPDLGADINFGLLVITASVVPFLILGQYLYLLVQAEYRFTVSNVAWVTPPIVNALLNGALAAAHVLTPARAFATWVIGQVISMLILVRAVQRREGFGRPDRALAKSALSFGVRAHFGRVMLLGNYRVDQWILGAVAGSRELGIYSVAVSWAEILFFVPTVLSVVQRPDFARADRSEIGSTATAGTRASLLLTTPLAAFVFVAAPYLCEDVFGDEFAGSTEQLRLLVLGAFGICLLKILGASLTAQGRPNLETIAIGGAFVVTIALDAALIPTHGGVGAAIASTVAYSVGGVLVVYIFCRTFGVSPRRLLPRRSDPRWLFGLVLGTLRRS
jgi:O-antigen/teichoic acid export membrane protein